MTIESGVIFIGHEAVSLSVEPARGQTPVLASIDRPIHNIELQALVKM